MLPKGRADAIAVLYTADLPAALQDPAAVNAAVVDGFVVYSLRDGDPLLARVLDRGVATVVVDAPRTVVGADWVGSDDRGAMRGGGEYLRQLGHRSVGIISPQLNEMRHNGAAESLRWRRSGYALMRERIQGLAEGLGAEADAMPIEERFDPSVASGAEALNALLDRRPELTAVCALTDVLALGALAGARQRGITVPTDLTITGYDDVPEAALAGLTTVAQQHGEKPMMCWRTNPNRPPERIPSRCRPRPWSHRRRASDRRHLASPASSGRHGSARRS
jgi:DNA-binding LacI/PurR family transcriptional regulator